MVINFYELLTGLTYLFCRPKAVMVCIAHQYLFLHPDFTFPKENRLSLASLKFFTRITAIGAAKKLALSFRKMREVPADGIVVVPPLLRKEVLEMTPTKGDVKHWLKAIGKNRDWLAMECGTEKGTVNNWLSPSGPFPASAMLKKIGRAHV